MNPWRTLALISLVWTLCDGFCLKEVKRSYKDRKEKVEMSATRKKKLYSFTEARRIARGHGFDSRQEFIDYECAGAYQLPKNPEVIWDRDWSGWDDFLGVPLSFEKGRQVARSLGLKSQTEYMNFMREKQMDDTDLSSRLPYRPDLKYKTDWKGWKDWLGL